MFFSQNKLVPSVLSLCFQFGLTNLCSCQTLKSIYKATVLLVYEPVIKLMIPVILDYRYDIADQVTT